jgi:1,4-alpha-glucan branching enzyme
VRQFEQDGFEWVDLNHREDSVITYKRKSSKTSEDVLVILNMTPVVRHDWRIRVRGKRKWKEIFNSNDTRFYGTGDVFNPIVRTEAVKGEKTAIDIILNLPALGAVILG